MTKSKANLAFVITLMFALLPGLDKAIKRQMLSFISLMISCMCILTPLAPVASAAEPVSYSVFKTVIDVAGEGPKGNVTAAGDIIAYQINVNNTAGVPLTNVTVNDPMIGIINNVTDLGIGNNETLYGNYTVTQADINSNGNGTGFIINNVTVVCDQNTTFNNATATVPITSCTIIKTVTNVAGNVTGNVTAAGDVISYQINVNNTAGIPLTNVTVTDPMLGGLLNVTDLGIGSNETLYGNYTVTQTDLDNYGNGTGFIINNATVDCDQLGPKNSTVQIPIDPHYSIEKIVTDVAGKGPGGNVTVTGDIISYQINVTNDGKMDLTNATVTDPLIGNTTGPSSSINNDTILNAGEIWTYTGNYTVTQADIDNYGNGTGFIINNATVDCDQLGPKNATVQVLIDPHYSIEKIVTDVAGKGSGGNVTLTGDVISYQINVTNDGKTDLTNVTVTDPLIGNTTGPSSSINNDTILNAGEIWTYTGNYTVTRADITNNGNGTGFIINNATVDCDQLGPKNSTVQVPIDTNASIEGIITDVAGKGPGGNVTAAGDIITYQVNVTNTGITDITNVTVNSTLTDLMGPTSSLNNDTVLNPGETWTYRGNYTVTSDDINNNGTIVGGSNTSAAVTNATGANATGANSTGANSTDTSAADIEELIRELINSTAASDILGNGSITVPQDDIINNGTVLGESNTSAAGIEDLISELNNNSTQAPETSGNGFIKDIVTFDSDQLGPKDAFIQVPIEKIPHYSMSKSVISPDDSGDCIVNSPGDDIPYRIVVTNDGNVDLTGVLVNDPMINLTGPSGDDSGLGILNPGETWVYNGVYLLTPDDINNGNSVDNTASVSSNELPEVSSSVSQPIEQNVDLSIQKSLTGIDEAGDFMINQPGDVINYRIVVVNNGDVDLHNVHLTDSLIDDLSGPSGDSVGSGVLNPGELWVYTGDYIVTQADIESYGGGTGFITNTATVQCKEHSSKSSSIDVPIIPVSNFGTDTNTGSELKADFTANPESGYAPLTVQFTDNSQNAETWSWDFNGDGNADSNVQNPSAYTYNTAGTYIANLTVSNASESASKPVTITVLQTGTSSSSGGSSGKISGGSANVVGSSSTENTHATPNATQTATTTPSVVQSTTPGEPTPAKNNTSKPVQPGKKTPGFETFFGITALLSAVYLYRRS